MRTDYPLLILLAVTIVIGGASALSGQPRPWEPLPENRRTYYNHEFGFSLEIPFAASVCDPLENNQDIGITVFLDGGGAYCPTGPDRRFMAYLESYNSAEYLGPRAMLESWGCQGEISATDPLLFPFAIPALPMMCRESLADGYENFTLVGLANDDSIEVQAYFQTQTAHFGADLEAFETMIRSMRRHEPDPGDARGNGWAAIHARILRETR